MKGKKNPEFFFDIFHIYNTGLDQNCFQNQKGQCCGSESERIRAFLAESEIFVPDSDSDPDPVI
jgi:hypothetical protein